MINSKGSIHSAFQIGDKVRKKSGSQWQDLVVSFYSTTLTPEGYCVESESHSGSVQIYPASALKKVCCEPTSEELKLLAEGSYSPEELWGGSEPSCPKCFNK